MAFSNNLKFEFQIWQLISNLYLIFVQYGCHYHIYCAIVINTLIKVFNYV